MKYICTACGHIDEPKRIAQGSFLGEVAVWIALAVIASFTTWLLMFIACGYTLMRQFSGKTACALCKGTKIIPVDSPNGQMMMKTRTGLADK